MTVCDGAGCREQDKSVKTRVDPSIDPEQQDRLAKLQELAEQDPQAAFDLAMRYFRGDDVQQDSYQAIVWMRSAAERGDAEAQLALGRLYLTGLEETGVDLIESEKWLLAAASQDNQEAKDLLQEVEPALSDQRAYDQNRLNWQTRTERYWRYRPVYYYRWDPRRRIYGPYY